MEEDKTNNNSKVDKDKWSHTTKYYMAAYDRAWELVSTLSVASRPVRILNRAIRQRQGGRSIQTLLHAPSAANSWGPPRSGTSHDPVVW